MDTRLALPAARYVGSNRDELYGDTEIVEAVSGLVLRLGLKRVVLRLRHYDRDVFVCQPPFESRRG